MKPIVLAFASITTVFLINSGASAQSLTYEKFRERCASIPNAKIAALGRVTEAVFVQPGGVQLAPPAPRGAMSPAPTHCLVRGKINERTGIDGKPYAIGYEVRLPSNWNGKFVFQGGGGMDGVLRPALGLLGAGVPQPNALSVGYATASTDSGHLEEAGPLGAYLFGLDPKARADKGYSSIPPTNAAARALIAHTYAKKPDRAYFAGCSNGGRQAMAATQRYPHMFDGVLVGAPAYRVPLAAIDAVGHNRAFMNVAPKDAQGRPDMGNALTMDELKLVANGINEACDGLDGIKDGMVNNVNACKFNIASVTCKPGQNSACLAPAKAKALNDVYRGTRNFKGEVIYSTWPWDPGLAHPGWTAWKIGTPGTWPLNARNMTLIPGSIAYTFSVPPSKPTDLLAYVNGFDFDKDTKKVMKGDGVFEAGMEFEAAYSIDLDKFVENGGKMLMYHGMSDPIFSATDSVSYMNSLKAVYGAHANDFSRLFLIPGMGHCAGGPATDVFDALSELDKWVETGKAPDSILARARNAPGVPWPSRTRPLCAYPKIATYNGSGNSEDAANFVCR